MRIRPYANRAFTLVELIAVIVVLAVLSAVALPRFLNTDVQARAKAIIADLRTMNHALREYRMTHGDWPPVATGNTAPALDPFLTVNPLGRTTTEPWYLYEVDPFESDPNLRLIRIHVQITTTIEPGTSNPVHVMIDQAIDDGNTETGRYYVYDWDNPGTTRASYDMNP